MLLYKPYLKYKKKVNLGKNVFINKGTTFEGYNSIGSKSSVSNSLIGLGTYMGQNNCLIGANIGRYCCIANNIKIIDRTHPTNTFVSFHPCFFSTRKQAGFTFTEKSYFSEVKTFDGKFSCVIGNDVWIGEDVKILGGVSIGNGAMIASGAVVTKNVEPYSIVGGVPAKLIQYRFNKEQIDFLEEFKWWNKDFNWLSNNAEDMRCIDMLMKKHKTN